MRGLVLLLLLTMVLLGAYGCGPAPTPGVAPTQLPPKPSKTMALAQPTPAPPTATATEPAATAMASPTPSLVTADLPMEAALGESWTRPVDGMEMTYVPAGSFEMGSDDPFYNNENPPHMVEVEGFWIDRTEVTNAQYGLCEEAGVCKPPKEAGSFMRDAYYGDAAYASYPVIWVNWYRAVAYCKWAGGRLPTEAEWEYAARGPEARWYPWGDMPDGTRLNYCDANCPLGHANQNANDGHADTAPVGSYPQGASWCGALDMLGNVWEWVWDWYGFYPSEENPSWLASDMKDRVLRGGSWDTDVDHARCTFRNWLDPAKSHDSVGFRCVVSASPPDSD